MAAHYLHVTDIYSFHNMNIEVLVLVLVRLARLTFLGDEERVTLRGLPFVLLAFPTFLFFRDAPPTAL